MHKITTTTLTLFAFVFATLTAQPALITDLNVGTGNGFNEFNYSGIKLNDAYLMPASDGVLGEELYQLKNGALTLLKDLNPGAPGSEPNTFLTSNGLVYFAAKGADNLVTLWQSDGSAAGTVQVAATATLPLSYLMMDKNGVLYFQTGSKICYYDPPSGNTSVLAGTPGGTSFEPDYNSTGAMVCPSDDGLVFVVTSSSQINFWKVAGSGITKLYTRTTPGSFTDVYGLTPLGNDILFTIDNSVYPDDNGLYLFRSADSTTTRIVNAAGNELKLPRRMKTFSDTRAIFMDASNVYVTDGTAAGTLVLSGAPGLYSGQPWNTAIVPGKMIFEAEQGSFQVKIRATDGTPAGTSLVATTDDPFVSPMLSYLDHVWWASGTSNSFKPTIWHTDMQALTSGKIYSYTTGSPIKSVIPVAFEGNKLYVLSNMGGVGRELYALTVSQNTGTSQLAPEPAPYRFVQQGNGFTIENGTSLPEQVEVTVCQSGGRVVEQASMFTGQWNSTANLPAGIYFCQIRGAQGAATVRFFQGN